MNGKQTAIRLVWSKFLYLGIRQWLTGLCSEGDLDQCNVHYLPRKREKERSLSGREAHTVRDTKGSNKIIQLLHRYRPPTSSIKSYWSVPHSVVSFTHFLCVYFLPFIVRLRVRRNLSHTGQGVVSCHENSSDSGKVPEESRGEFSELIPGS